MSDIFVDFDMLEKVLEASRELIRRLILSYTEEAHNIHVSKSFWLAIMNTRRRFKDFEITLIKVEKSEL